MRRRLRILAGVSQVNNRKKVYLIKLIYDAKATLMSGFFFSSVIYPKVFFESR